MPRTYRAPLLLIVLSVPLGACSSLFGMHLADRQSRAMPASQPVPVALASPAPTQTMLARQQLADGQVGAAIETFQKALDAGEDRAPAINGLGVAYARLGRSDLALRYFEEATTIAPADSRYASNLALLLNSQTAGQGPALASSLPAQQAAPKPAPVRGMLERVSANEFHIVTADIQPAPLPSLAVKAAPRAEPSAPPALAQVPKAPPMLQPSAAAQRPTIVRVAASDARLQRVSRGEVRIATNEPKPAPTAPKAANLDERFRPVVRIALEDVPSRHPAGLIRIVLPELQLASGR